MSRFHSHARWYLAPAIAWVGTLICLVLVVSHARQSSLFCGPAAGCDAVTESAYAKVAGVPLALVGLGSWSALLAGLLAVLFLRDAAPRRRLLQSIRAAAIFGAVASAGLIAIQAFRLHAFCPLCCGSAACFFALALLTGRASAPEGPLLPLAGAPALSLGVLGTLGTFAAALLLATPPPDATAPKILATLDGLPITENDLPMSLRLAIQPLEEQAAKLRLDWLDQRLDELALEREGKRRGLAPQALLAQETAAAARVTPADLAAWRKAHPDDDLPAPYDPTPRVRLAKESAAEDAYLARLRTAYAAAIRVHPPTPPIVHFDLTHAELDGQANAPAVFVIFSDFECAFCRELDANLRAVRRQLGDRVAIAYKHLPLEAIHPKARAFALAAIAAGEQGKFWEYQDALISKDLPADDAALIEQARVLGLHVPRFTKALHSQETADRLAADAREAEMPGIQQTPSSFLNGRSIDTNVSSAVLVRLARAGNVSPPEERSVEETQLVAEKNPSP